MESELILSLRRNRFEIVVEVYLLKNRFGTIVLGLGAMGGAAAYQLAKQRRDKSPMLFFLAAMCFWVIYFLYTTEGAIKLWA